MNPKVSVILTTYNRSELLKYAIESVLNQTFKDFELIIVDDNSIDNTSDIVLSYRDERIVYIKQATNSGYQCIPKNDGIKAANGSYIAYLDDDNRYTKDHIKVLADALDATPGIDVVYGNRQHLSRDGFGEVKIGNAKKFEFDELCEGLNYIDTSDIMHRKRAIYKIGGWDPQIKSMGDYDLILRLAKSGCKFQFIPKVITYYYHHIDSVSARRTFDMKPEECLFSWGKCSLFKKIKDFFKRETSYLLKDNLSLRREFPKYVPTRVLKVDGLDDEVIYENRIIHFFKRLLRKCRYRFLKKTKDIKPPLELSGTGKAPFDDYKKIQLEESAWVTRHEPYQKLLKDSINYLACNLSKNHNLKILDMGCGDGFSLSVFKSHGFNNIIGIDLNHEKLKLAKKLGHNIFEGDIHNLPFNCEEFDVVFSSHVLEHSYDIKKAVEEIRRVTRKNGCLFIIVPVEKHTKNIAYRQPIADPKILIEIINEYKFDIIQETRIKRMEDELWLFCIRRHLEDGDLPIVVLDLDDFSPFCDNIELLLKLKERYPNFKASLFTIPNLNNKFQLSKFRSWCGKVRELDFVELLIHGYNHSPKEFKKISKDRAIKKIVVAEAEFIKTGLRYKKIFRAPYWQLNNETYSALSDLGYILADHKDNLAPRNLRVYQYNWSINDPVPNFTIIRGHGHIQKTCGNGLEECFENLLSFPKETKFLTISESIELDSRIIRDK